MELKHATVVYLSSSGNTARVAGWIEEELLCREFTVEKFTIPDIRGMMPRQILQADILFVGTPTYMWHTPRIVVEFLSALPEMNNKPVGLFVTFGGVTVGSNLAQMSRLIKKKKGRVAGLLQLEGEHAMMFKNEAPLAKGKPNEGDIPYIKRFVSLCLQRAAREDYSAKTAHGLMQYFSFLSPLPIAERVIPQVKLDSTKCTLCGACVENCPTGNITITEGVIRHGQDCLPCYNCVRVCSTAAADAKLQAMDKSLRLLSHLPDAPAAVY